MTSLLFFMLIFLSSFLIHLFLCRIYFFKSQVKIILLIFLINLLIGFSLIWLYDLHHDMFFNNFLLDCLRIFSLYLGMALVYCLVILSLLDDSPSIFTIMNIYNSGNKGMSKSELEKTIKDEIFIIPRFHYLLEEQMVDSSKNMYFITKKGKMLLHTFLLVRKIMKMSRKPG